MMDAATSSQPELKDAEDNLFLPPRRLWRYQISKLIVAGIVVCIFVGWLMLRWYNVPMRLLTLGLLGMTVYVTAKSVLVDYHRARGRQLAVQGHHLTIQRDNEQQAIDLDELVEIEWRDEVSTELGLWLLGADGEALAHLDEGFVNDQREARALLGWLRQQTGRNWPTRWP